MLKKLFYENKRDFFVFQLSIILSSAVLIGSEFFKGLLLESAVSGEAGRFGRVALSFLGAVAVNAGLFFIYSRAFRSFEAKALCQIRRRFFADLLRLPFVKFREEDPGSYVSDYSNQPDAISFDYFQSVYGSEQVIFEIFFCVISLLLIELRFALLTILIMLLPAFLPLLFKRQVKSAADAALEENNRCLAKFRDFLNGLDEIKDFRKEEAFGKNFAEQSRKLRKKENLAVLTLLGSVRFSALAAELAYAAVLFLALRLLSRGVLSLALFMAGAGIALRLKSVVSLVTYYIGQFHFARAPLKRIERFSQVEQGKSSGCRLSEPALIQFSGVHFKYGDEEKELLSDFNFCMEEKGIYIFSGRSGSGKTTAANLLMNYYAPDRGEISINHIPDKVS